MHDHTAIVKKVQIAAPLFGMIAIASIPFSLAFSGAIVTTGLALTGSALIGAAVLSYVFLRYVSCDKYQMHRHSFDEGQCFGGRLYYRGNVPILELNDDPSQENYGYRAGQAHGYLLGPHIYELKKNLELLIHTILREPRAHKLTELLQQVRRELPQKYIQEMKGLKDGYNQWAKSANITTSMTEDDVLLIQLIADSKHFHPKKLKHLFRGVFEEVGLDLSVACTRLLYRNRQMGVIAAGNTDWCPFGKGGNKSLVIVWKPENVAVLGVPGQIGAITGWNEELVAMMNVCPGKTTRIRGKPAGLYNRDLLANCHSVSSARRLISQVGPLGPYHLTLADKKEGVCVSIKQGKNEDDYIRTLEDDKPLTVVNWRYPDCKRGFFNSAARAKLLQRYFAQAQDTICADRRDWCKLMNNALNLTPLVNSKITLHSLLFLLKDKKVFLGWDNGYAASAKKECLSMAEVF